MADKDAPKKAQDDDAVKKETTTLGVKELPDDPKDSKDAKGTAPANDGLAASGAQTPHKRRRLSVLDFKDLPPWKRAVTIKWAVALIVVGVVFLTMACVTMRNSALTNRSKWWDPNEEWVQTYNKRAESLADQYGATHVKTGTYVENIRSVDIKNWKTNVTLLVWFRWDGADDLDMVDNFNIYRGIIQTKDILSETHENGVNYQLVRVNVDVNNQLGTALFPVDTQQVRIFVESEYKAERVILDPDVENSTVNSSLSIAGYEITNTEWGEAAHVYNSSQGDPTVTSAPVTSEFVTALTFRRNGLGLYFKCFIAMYGTTLWVLIMLYICGHHRVDPLGMIPGALFGTVSNIMVGAALLPDALDMGLLEFVNVWGILTILATAVVIIQVNNIRSQYGRKDEPFAGFIGRVMFYIIAVIAIAGNILLPAFAMSV
ncbi:MAG: hypothetical protein LKE37_06740 [Atopobiaceae bacterium]|jgi:hypothetical protein|nr:hypothetical protein [Atopobiaceae bacterium]